MIENTNIIEKTIKAKEPMTSTFYYKDSWELIQVKDIWIIYCKHHSNLYKGY